MDVIVNAKILYYALNDEKFKAETIEYLNGIVDEELEKGDRMDTDLIEDCTELIFELENGYDVLFFERETAKKIIKFCHRKTVNKNRYRQIAAAVAVMLIAHTATYATVPAYANAVDSFTSRIFELLENASKKTDDGSDEYAQINVIPPEDFNNTVNSVDEVNLDGCKVYAIPYENVNENLDPIKDGVEIPLSKCKIGKPKTETDGGRKYIEITVSYKGHSDIVEFNLSKGE